MDDVLGLRVVGNSPVISPDGRAVLFTVRSWIDAGGGKKDARTAIWRAPADGLTPARQITFGDRGESQPDWSPDGRSMSFVATRGTDARAQVWVLRADGGEARPVTAAAENVQAYAWSPDSRRLAYTVADPLPAAETSAIERRDDERLIERPAAPVHLWVVEVATVPPPASRAATRSRFRAAFRGHATTPTSRSRPAPAPALLRDGRRDIYVADLAKTAEACNIGPDTNPRLSPDGRSVAYLATPVTAPAIADGTPKGTVGQQHVMVYDLATKATRDVTGQLAVDPGDPRRLADDADLPVRDGHPRLQRGLESRGRQWPGHGAHEGPHPAARVVQRRRHQGRRGARHAHRAARRAHRRCGVLHLHEGVGRESAGRAVRARGVGGHHLEEPRRPRGGRHPAQARRLRPGEAVSAARGRARRTAAPS